MITNKQSNIIISSACIITVYYVAGIDSRYNEGCSELANFLFYGLYGQNQMSLDPVLQEFPEEVLDGMLLDGLISEPFSVFLLCCGFYTR